MPRSTWLRRGMLSNAGILYPCCKCSFLTAVRYTLIVLCDVFELANAVQNLHSNCSGLGVGDACNCSHNSTLVVSHQEC